MMEADGKEGFELFATAARGIEDLLASELISFGASEVKVQRAGVSFRGTLEVAYRACLWSRLASRVLLPLTTFAAGTAEQLYAGTMAVDWGRHVRPTGTMAVDVTLSDSQITHSNFAALTVKDAVVDQLRERFGVRPDVDVERPDLRLNLHLRLDQAVLSVDLSGQSLHRRGYRQPGLQVEAPLKENVAAAVLLRAGWPAIAAAGGPLVDPMCGSGTLVIEGALMAGDVAPGLIRDYFGFLGWLGHDAPLWDRLTAEARERRDQGLTRLPTILGLDHDPRALAIARTGVERAGLGAHIELRPGEISALRPPHSPVVEGAVVARGLLVVNPPYGARLGSVSQLAPLYAQLGARLREGFAGWDAAVLTGEAELGHSLGLSPTRVNTLYNGAIEVRLLRFRMNPARFAPSGPKQRSEGAQMFANRLAKDHHHFGRWARRQGIGSYRVYDSDLPEYALAVDVYEEWVHVQEYQAPVTIDAATARRRLREALEVIPEALEVSPDNVFLKVRRRQRGAQQYQRAESAGLFHEVQEGGLRFLVNFTDYLDTGLFLDHRLVREQIRSLAQGRRFLNLFGYTGTASVYAAAGGASETTTVDLSNVYLEWAARNFGLNRLDTRTNRVLRADVLDWVVGGHGQYDLILLDPPTFSNSKGMEAASFDVQRDQGPLLSSVARLLSPGGILVFSSNYRRFRLDDAPLAGFEVKDLSETTLPPDFARRGAYHHVWQVTKPGKSRSRAWEGRAAVGPAPAGRPQGRER